MSGKTKTGDGRLRRLKYIIPSVALLLLNAIPSAAAFPWLASLLVLAVILLGLAVASKILQVIMWALALVILLNPCVYDGGMAGACPQIIVGNPATGGWLRLILTRDPYIRSMNLAFINLLYPVYIIMVMVYGIYIIFFSTSPSGRARAKDTLVRIFVGMIFVSLSPVLFQLALNLTHELSVTLIDQANRRIPSWTQVFYVARAEMCVISLLAIPVAMMAAIVAGMRYFIIMILAAIFPLTLFFYFIPYTRSWGQSLLKFTIITIFVQFIQVILLTVTVLSTTPGGGFMSFIIAVGGLYGIVLSPLIGMKLMGWLGATVHLYSTRGGYSGTRFIATIMRGVPVGSAFQTAGSQWISGHTGGPHWRGGTEAPTVGPAFWWGVPGTWRQQEGYGSVPPTQGYGGYRMPGAYTGAVDYRTGKEGAPRAGQSLSTISVRERRPIRPSTTPRELKAGRIEAAPEIFARSGREAIGETTLGKGVGTTLPSHEVSTSSVGGGVRPSGGGVVQPQPTVRAETPPAGESVEFGGGVAPFEVHGGIPAGRGAEVIVPTDADKARLDYHNGGEKIMNQHAKDYASLLEKQVREKEAAGRDMKAMAVLEDEHKKALGRLNEDYNKQLAVRRKQYLTSLWRPHEIEASAGERADRTIKKIEAPLMRVGEKQKDSVSQLKVKDDAFKTAVDLSRLNSKKVDDEEKSIESTLSRASAATDPQAELGKIEGGEYSKFFGGIVGGEALRRQFDDTGFHDKGEAALELKKLVDKGADEAEIERILSDVKASSGDKNNALIARVSEYELGSSMRKEKFEKRR